MSVQSAEPAASAVETGDATANAYTPANTIEPQAETPWMSTAEAVAAAEYKVTKTESAEFNPLVDQKVETQESETVFEAAKMQEEAFANADTELAEPPVTDISAQLEIAEPEVIEAESASPKEALADTLYDSESESLPSESKPIVNEFSLDMAPLSQPIVEDTKPGSEAEPAEVFPGSDLDFVETVPYVPADFAKHNLKVDEAVEPQPVPIESMPSADMESPSLIISEPVPADSEISPESMPASADSSVMATPEIEAVAIPYAAPATASIAPEESASPNVPSQAVPAPSSDLEKDARSFTDPNLSISDTDGKKAKLKPLTDGTVLNNRYEIVRKIGGGGMGAVYLANDRNLGGVLRAVKEMVQSYIEEDQQEKAVNDFKRESMLLTSLDHTAIPTIFDYFYDEKEARFYLVMKYISGGDLASRLRSTPEGKINELTVTEWAIQIADVLDYLHNHQPPIVYRDLKPSNIMVDGNSGRVMLIDFGIARWVNKEEKGVTAVGTMGYAPPELFSGNVEPRSDIYSLGSTMFHLLTGADPQSNPLLIFDFNKNPRPRQINSQLTDQIEQILMRSVEYNADKRFDSAAELKKTLIQHLENLKQGSVSFGVIDTASGVQPLSSVPVFCGFCGQKIVASDLFCPFCGAQQPIAQQQAATLQPQAVYAPVQVQSQPTARLMVIGTSDLERSEFTLDKESNLVGRRDPMSNIFPEIDLSKFDPQTKVSRRHARIWKDSGRFMVEDLGSSNGTVLMNPNAVPVRLLPHQPQALASGDKIKVGDTTLHFVTS